MNPLDVIGAALRAAGLARPEARAPDAAPEGGRPGGPRAFEVLVESDAAPDAGDPPTAGADASAAGDLPRIAVRPPAGEPRPEQARAPEVTEASPGVDAALPDPLGSLAPEASRELARAAAVPAAEIAPVGDAARPSRERRLPDATAPLPRGPAPAETAAPPVPNRPVSAETAATPLPRGPAPAETTATPIPQGPVPVEPTATPTRVADARGHHPVDRAPEDFDPAPADRADPAAEPATERSRETARPAAGAAPSAPAAPAIPAAAAAVVAGQADQGLVTSAAAAPSEWRLAAEAPAPAARPELAAAPAPQPQAVAAQITVAVATARERQVEIRLDPPELGKVQIQLEQTETGLRAVVLAERPETYDLLRRHADILQRDLAGAGYRNVDLGFAAGGQAGERGTGGRDFSAADDVASASPGATPQGRSPSWAVDGALDIRL